MNDTLNPRPVTPQEADELAKLCCSDCWRPIQKTFRWNREAHQNDHFVFCGTPDCPMHGYVSKRFVEQRTQISYTEYRTARDALRHLLPMRVATETQILAELGVFA